MRPRTIALSHLGAVLPVLVLLGTLAALPCRAAGPDPAPGLLGYLGTPLEVFATSPNTRAACRMLRQGNKADGVQALSRVVSEHPEDLVAAFALTQSAALEEQRTMLAERKRAVAAKNTPIRQFRLAAAAWCLMAKAKYGGGVHPSEEATLAQVAGTALARASRGSRDPFLWYFVGVAASDVPGLDQAAAFDKALDILLGAAEGAKYQKAATSGWRGPAPDLPAGKDRLARMQYILRDCTWTRCQPKVHLDVTVDRAGRSTTKRREEPLRPEQAAARQYFDALLSRIKDRIGRPD